MLRWISALGAALCLAIPVGAEEVSPPASKRFAAARSEEKVSFQRHVMPLLGRLGCNGRACHGSFQGRGGFRLSLFGYDFQADHDALTKGKSPRVDLKDPAESLILQKPTLGISHKGGKRLQLDSWQYHVIRRWIEDGGKNDASDAVRLLQLVVLPERHLFRRQGEKLQLKVIARWSDGTAEDVTEVCRFRSNDDAVAAINDAGEVTAAGKGDTHVVAFYDNGVTPIPVILPVSDLIGDRYPDVAAPTKIDQLVNAKLRQCGILPSEVSTDAEFLRRVSVDITGTLPRREEIDRFLADTSADKRTKKIDELLSRPEYAIWWATRLCDYTGNSGKFREPVFGQEYATQWYEWIHRRVAENVAYDKMVAGIVLASGRKPGQSLEEYSREMSSYYRKDSPADFSQRETMPHFWARTSFQDPKERALGFTYSFLGVHLQCAQCHKHPFDQWTKKDFEQFTVFFDRIIYGTPPEDREQYVKMVNDAAPASKEKGKQADGMMAALAREGKTVPFHEVYIAEPGDTGLIKGPVKPVVKKKVPAGRKTAPKLLGGDELTRDAPEDLRGVLMTWLRRPDNPYFARAFVNRVWACYFNVGIVDPPDDLSLANPPSNAALLDYLTRSFIDHGYDMKWLHREIVTSRTYQLTWKPNDTNRLDTRNFSHAVPRRLPAEVAYDAMIQATAASRDVEAWQRQAGERAIGIGSASNPRQRGKFGNILTVFGKPDRLANCDCERSNDPSLLQTLYLLNDAQIQGLLNRPPGWVAQLGQEFSISAKAAKTQPQKGDDPAARAATIAKLQRRLQELQKEGNEAGIAKVKRALAELERASAAALSKPKTLTPEEEQNLIREAFLRTVSRPPTEKEIALARAYFKDSTSLDAGVRDLLWALINTSEFLVNH
jgi:hypothetical protein